MGQNKKTRSWMMPCMALLLLVVITGPALADTLTLLTTQDVYIETSGKANNVLYTGVNTSGESFIYEKYDLSSLVVPVGQTLTINSVTLGGVSIYHWGPQIWEDGIYAVADNSWTYAGITWANKPAMGTQLTSIPFPDTSWTNYYSTPTTALNDFVAAQYAAPGQIISFGIKAPSGTTSEHGYNGSANTYSETYDPYLSIDYTLNPIPEPISLALLGLGGLPLLLRRRR